MWRDTETLWSYAIDADTTRSICVLIEDHPASAALAPLHARRGSTAQTLVQLEELERLHPRLAQPLEHALKQVTQ